ncbi:MAG: peptide deformylase [Thermodesulfobacteriota bacterium]
MSLLNILTYPDPFLKTKARPVDAVDDDVRALIDDMVETMRSARGIGLAATQVGDERRVIVLDVPEEVAEESDEDEREEERRIHLTLVNPEIVSREGETKFEEGCLSVPGFTADVKRAAVINVTALDREGKQVEFTADDLLSIAIQHEIDHLDGILFIDRLSRLKRELLKRKIKKALDDERTRL